MNIMNKNVLLSNQSSKNNKKSYFLNLTMVTKQEILKLISLFWLQIKKC